MQMKCAPIYQSIFDSKGAEFIGNKPTDSQLY